MQVHHTKLLINARKFHHPRAARRDKAIERPIGVTELNRPAAIGRGRARAARGLFIAAGVGHLLRQPHKAGAVLHPRKAVLRQVNPRRVCLTQQLDCLARRRINSQQQLLGLRSVHHLHHQRRTLGPVHARQVRIRLVIPQHLQVLCRSVRLRCLSPLRRAANRGDPQRHLRVQSARTRVWPHRWLLGRVSRVRDMKHRQARGIGSLVHDRIAVWTPPRAVPSVHLFLSHKLRLTKAHRTLGRG